MEIKFKESRKTNLGLVIALGFFYYVFKEVSLDELVRSFGSIHLKYFFPAVVLLFLSYWARAYRWRALLLTFKKVPVTQVYFSMMTGFLGNVLPLRAGDFLRAYILNRNQDISLPGILATILMEFFFDILLLLALFIWVFKFNAEAFNFTFPDTGLSAQEVGKHFGQFCMVLISVLALFFYSFLRHKKKILALVGWLSRGLPQKWRNKLKSLFDNLSLGFSAVKNAQTLFQIILYSALEWLLTILSFYPMFLAYNLDVSSFGSLVILTVMIVVFTTILPTPGFLGSFNAGVYVALHHIMGESEVLAANFGLVAWALNFLVILISGFYFIVKYHFSFNTIWKEQ
jgi:glycosyltransferase 2 family protein